MQRLDRINDQFAAVLDPFGGRFGTPDCRIHRHPSLQARRTNGAGVVDGAALLFHRIDDQRDFVVLDHVNDMRTPLGYLVHRLHRQAGRLDGMCRTTRRHQLETGQVEMLGDLDGFALGSVDGGGGF